MVMMAVSLLDKGRWLHRPSGRTPLRGVWGDRLLSGHGRSAGACLDGGRGRADNSQPRHQASETSGQTRPAATTQIIAVKTSTAVA